MTANLHELLPLLDSQHLFLDAAADYEPLDDNLTRLAHSVDAINGLRLNRKTPPWINHEYTPRARQVEANTAGTQIAAARNPWVGS